MYQKVLKQIVVGIVALVLMVFVTACAGVGTSTSGAPTNVALSGSVVSVDLNNHSVTLNVNGQTKTINNVPNDILTSLQSQVGKVYSIQVTQNSDGSYNFQAGTNVTPESNETQSSNGTLTTNEPGSINFIGNVTNSSNGNIVVSMPNGSSLSMKTNGTNLEDFNGSLPGVGTRVSVEATANTDGSFTATKLSVAKSDDDASIVKFQGVTTSAVGSDHVIHFAVGNKSYSYAIASTADLTDFNNNAQSIGSNVSVKVTVQFSGTTGTAIKVETQNGQ